MRKRPFRSGFARPAWLAAIAVGVVVNAVSVHAAPDAELLRRDGLRAMPPSMMHREITKPTTAPAGEQVEIVDGDYKATLFVPAAYRPTGDATGLIVHFHGAPWFVIDEHLRHGLDRPLLVCSFGEGSSTYAKPFATDPERFGRFLARVEDALVERSPDHVRRPIRQIDITSFSAGYGAVREILRQDKFTDRIRRIILCDSLYAGWDPATTQPGATSRPLIENMQPWATFVERAARGEKTFVFVHSQVPTHYANTAATADWIIDHVHATKTPIHKGDTPAADDVRYPLLYRADVGHLHIWGYAGEDAQAHMTSVRHLADVWKAMDACGDGR